MQNILDSKIEISPDVLFQEISGETVLLDLKSEAYFGLDATATRIWQLLQEGHDPQQVCEIMFSEFEVGRDDLERDLAQYLQELADAGLINVREQESG